MTLVIFIIQKFVEVIAKAICIMLDVLMNLFNSMFGLRGSDTLDTFLAAFPIAAYSYQIFVIGGFFILFTICVVQLFKSLFGPLTEAEDPVKLVIRTCFFALLIAFSYQICSIIIDIGTVFNTAIEGIDSASLYSATLLTADSASGLVGDVINATAVAGEIAAVSYGNVIILSYVVMLYYLIFREYGHFLLEIGERYIILGLLTIISPLCIATGASKTTGNIFRSWLQMYISQVVLLVFATFFLKTFNLSFSIFTTSFTSNEVTIYGTTEKVNLITPLLGIMLIAWLRQGQKIDQHMSALGLSVAQAGGFGMAFANSLKGAQGAANGVINRAYGTNFGQPGGYSSPMAQRLALGGAGMREARMKDAMDTSGGPKRAPGGFAGSAAAKAAVQNGEVMSGKAVNQMMSGKTPMSGASVGSSVQAMGFKNANGEPAIPSNWKATDNCTVGNGQANLQFAEMDKDGNVVGLHNVSLSNNPTDKDAKGQISNGNQTMAVTGMDGQATSDAVLGKVDPVGNNEQVTEADGAISADAEKTLDANGAEVKPEDMAQFNEDGTIASEINDETKEPGEEGFSVGDEQDNQFVDGGDYDEKEAEELAGMAVGATDDVTNEDGIIKDDDGSIVAATAQDSDGNDQKINADDLQHFGGKDGNTPLNPGDEGYEAGSLRDANGNMHLTDAKAKEMGFKDSADADAKGGVKTDNQFVSAAGGLVGSAAHQAEQEKNAMKGSDGKPITGADGSALQFRDAATGASVSQGDLKKFDSEGNEVKSGSAGYASAGFLNKDGNMVSKNGTEMAPMTANQANNFDQAKTRNTLTEGANGAKTPQNNVYKAGDIQNAKQNATNAIKSSDANQIQPKSNIAKFTGANNGLTSAGTGNKAIAANGSNVLQKATAQEGGGYGQNQNKVAFDMGAQQSGAKGGAMIADANGTYAYDNKNKEFVPVAKMDKNAAPGTYSSQKFSPSSQIASKSGMAISQQGSSSSGITAQTGADGKAMKFNAEGKADAQGGFIKDSNTGTLISSQGLIQDGSGNVSQFESVAASANVNGKSQQGLVDVAAGATGQSGSSSGLVKGSNGAEYASQSFVGTSGQSASGGADSVATFKTASNKDGYASMVQNETGTGYQSQSISVGGQDEKFYRTTGGDLVMSSAVENNAQTGAASSYSMQSESGGLVQDADNPGSFYRPVQDYSGGIPSYDNGNQIQVHDGNGGIMSITPSQNQGGGIATYSSQPNLVPVNISDSDVRTSFAPNAGGKADFSEGAQNYVSLAGGDKHALLHESGISGDGSIIPHVADTSSPTGFRPATQAEATSGKDLYAATVNTGNPDAGPNFQRMKSDAGVSHKESYASCGVQLTEKDGTYYANINTENFTPKSSQQDNRVVASYQGRTCFAQNSNCYKTNNSAQTLSLANGVDLVFSDTKASPFPNAQPKSAISGSAASNVVASYGLNTTQGVGSRGFNTKQYQGYVSEDQQSAVMWSGNQTKGKGEAFITSKHKLDGIAPVSSGPDGYAYRTRVDFGRRDKKGNPTLDMSPQLAEAMKKSYAIPMTTVVGGFRRNKIVPSSSNARTNRKQKQNK